LRLLAMARHVASTRLVPQANRLGLASHSQAESALASWMRAIKCLKTTKCMLPRLYRLSYLLHWDAPERAGGMLQKRSLSLRKYNDVIGASSDIASGRLCGVP
jgi:hypothetical protein